MRKSRAIAKTLPSLARRRVLLGLAAAASIAILADWAWAQKPPAHTAPTTALIEFKGGAVAVGIGFSWGGGTVTFDGKQYPISVNGLSALDVGASKYSASGTVRNLHNIKDIEGTYMAGELGATVAGGGSVASMKNDKGVIIDFNTTRAGLQFTIAPKGATIKLKK
jgi:hypothetical protein